MLARCWWYSVGSLLCMLTRCWCYAVGIPTFMFTRCSCNSVWFSMYMLTRSWLPQANDVSPELPWKQYMPRKTETAALHRKPGPTQFFDSIRLYRKECAAGLVRVSPSDAFKATFSGSSEIMKKNSCMRSCGTSLWKKCKGEAWKINKSFQRFPATARHRVCALHTYTWHIHIHLYSYICICNCYIYIYTYIYVYVHLHWHIHLHVCICTCKYMYMSICILYLDLNSSMPCKIFKYIIWYVVNTQAI